MARLFVLSGASIGATHEIEGTSVLGRGADADVVIPEPSVSRRHARLVPGMEAGVWKLVDLGSSNGVHVGGRRVSEARVRDGESFMLGEVELRLRDEAAEDEGAAGELELEFEDEPTPAPAAAPAPASRRAGPAEAEPAEADADAEGLRRARARAAEDRAARRAAALDAPGTAPRRSTATAGGQVLQYSQHRKGDDLSQLPAWKRGLLTVLAVALAAGVAYGAFELTRTVRGQAAAISD